MIFKKIKENLILNGKNIPGRRLKRNIVVIESDDWGSVRMPTADIHKKLTKRGFDFNNRYDRYDTLADDKDLGELFSVLHSVSDKNGNPAVITPFVNVSNPDFGKIKEGRFQEFFFVPFTQTLKDYGRSTETLTLWIQGMKQGVFSPEFHGNTHISVPFWIDELRKGNGKLLEAFEHGLTSIQLNNIKESYNGFRTELYFENPIQVTFIENALNYGLKQFRVIFGAPPRVYAPTNGIYHPVFEKVLRGNGIRYVYVSWLTKIPNGRGGLKSKFFQIGSKDETGMTYYTRNCLFEPSHERYQGVDKTLKQVSIAFKWGKPAIISTHRVNFIGAISKSNRENGLRELKKLLAAVKKQWPHIEFMSSADMLNILFH